MPTGGLVSGDAPTKEVPLHTALYETRAPARAVVHLHSTHSVALSMLPEIDPRAALPPMTAYYLMKCGATALVPYYRPGDPAVADAIKGLAGKYSSVLLANHGPVVSGDTLNAAVFAIEELEETAKLYLLLRGLNPRYLTPAQIADLVKVFGLNCQKTTATELVIARSVGDEAIHAYGQFWIASRSLSSGAHSRDPLARNNDVRGSSG